MLYEVSDHVATISFNHPERANALDLGGWHALRDQMQRADKDREVHVVILRGEGKHFCAGIDLSVLQGLPKLLKEGAGAGAGKLEKLTAFIQDLQDCITAIEHCRKPVIATVHGSCIGGGVDIITACDMRYATRQATFSVKEVDLGIVADLGTLQRLPRIVAPGVAAELAFTGRNFDGKEAAAIGLVNEALNGEGQLTYRVDQVAAAIAAKPPRIIAGIKRSLLQQRDATLSAGLDFVADYSARTMLGRNPV
jgi:enoyl-CoA hydratase